MMIEQLLRANTALIEIGMPYNGRKLQPHLNKNKPDATGEVSAQSGATETSPIFGRTGLVAGFNKSISSLI